MKAFSLLLALAIVLLNLAPAGACTPDVNITTSGFYPVSVANPKSPCFTIGQNDTAVVYFRNYDQFTVNSVTVDIDSIRFDSIVGLPCGISWQSNKATNTFSKLEHGCLTYSGISFSPEGVYKPEIYFSIWADGLTTSFSQSASALGIQVNAKSLEQSTNCNIVTDTLVAQPCFLMVSFATAAGVCPGTQITLSPIIIGGQSPYTYNWSASNNNLSCYTCANPVATINSFSTFSVTVTDANGIWGVKSMGRGDTYGHVDVGVYFGDTQNATDPYFNGLGPKRTGCIECAGCMVGCRHGAKNSLDKNYLYFAQQYGAEVVAETLVTRIEHIDGIYHVHTQSSTSWFKKNVQMYKAKGLVVSGGVLGTMDLLLKQKYQYKTLPHLSDTLGENLRTNSESLCGVIGGNQTLNHGVAISSVFNPDDHTHVEIVKFPDGSDAMVRLSTLATGEGQPLIRTAKMIGNILTKPGAMIKLLFTRNLPRTSIIFLVMQTLDNSMKMVWKRRWFGGGGMAIDNSGQAKVPAYIPIGQEVMHRYAEKTGGVAMNSVMEVMFNMSSTAHILGGCPMGETTAKGVVNERFEVHGYPNMYILDGSIIPCNLGVNPSLTITALSEYAMAQVADKVGNVNMPLERRMAEGVVC